MQLPDAQHHNFLHACRQTNIRDWQPLNTQGSSNYLFRSGASRQILRVNAPPERAVGVCRTREAGIMELLQDQPWMVKVIQNQPEHNWCSLKDYDDQHSAAILSTAKQQLPGIISQLQSIQAPSARLNFKFEAIWSVYGKIISLYSEDPHHKHACDRLDAELKKTRQLQQQLPDTPEVLGHQDLHSGNLTLNNGQLVLLDWEYAGLCQPWLDAAGLISQFGFSHKTVNQLPAFKHLDEAIFSSAANTAITFNKQLEILWLQAREITDNNDQ